MESTGIEVAVEVSQSEAIIHTDYIQKEKVKKRVEC